MRSAALFVVLVILCDVVAVCTAITLNKSARGSGVRLVRSAISPISPVTATFVTHTGTKAEPAYRVVCVYTNWSQYRPGDGRFLPEDVDPSLCTHLIYVYAKLKGSRLEPTEWNDDGNAWSDGMYTRVNELKQINPSMKTLLGVGGWTMGSKDFSKMASRRATRHIFAKSSVKFLRDRQFDGLTIDWQHPTKRGGRRHDKRNFSFLLQAVRRAFEKESKASGLPRLLLTAGLAASKAVIDAGYEMENISKYTDFMNVMAYDLHGSWENMTGHPSQLYPRPGDVGPRANINVDWSMKYLVDKGTDRSKLVLGISTYSRTFTLRNHRRNGYMAMTKGPGEAAEFTQQAGMLAYYERCSQYAGATRVWDSDSQVAYWHSGDTWIGGEDVESVKAKVDYMRYNSFGGLMFNAVDMDDFLGWYCDAEPYPLLTALNSQLTVPLPKTTPRPTTTTTTPVTTTTTTIMTTTTTATLLPDIKLEEWKPQVSKSKDRTPPAVIPGDANRIWQSRFQPQSRLRDRGHFDRMFRDIINKPMVKPRIKNMSPRVPNQKMKQDITKPFGIKQAQNKVHVTSGLTANLHQTTGLRPAPSFLSDVLKLFDSNSFKDMSKILNDKPAIITPAQMSEQNAAGSGRHMQNLPLMPAVMLKPDSFRPGEPFQPRIVVPAIIQEPVGQKPAFSGHLFNTFDVSDGTHGQFKSAVVVNTNSANRDTAYIAETTTKATLKPIPFQMPESKQTKPVVMWFDLKDLGFLVS